MIRIKTIFLFLYLVANSVICFAQPDSLKTLEVYGSTRMLVPSDEATFSFAVRGTASNLRDAVNNAKKKIAKITKDLYSIGLDEQNLSTSNFYSGENDGNKAFLSSKRDFKADISMIVRIDSLELLEESVIIVSENDVESISEINFTVKELELKKLSAIKEATLKAKQKAERMAIYLGVILKSPVRIIEEISSKNMTGLNIRGGRSNLFNSIVVEEASPFVEGGTFYSQLLTIDSTVKVIFEIQ